jgi:hypothetical protein
MNAKQTPCANKQLRQQQASNLLQFVPQPNNSSSTIKGQGKTPLTLNTGPQCWEPTNFNHCTVLAPWHVFGRIRNCAKQRKNDDARRFVTTQKSMYTGARGNCMNMQLYNNPSRLNWHYMYTAQQVCS